MTRFKVFVRRVRSYFFKSKLERELADEIHSHLEMQIEENARQGMGPDEARFAALRKFGGVDQVKEAYRDRRGLWVVETTFQDVRYALRIITRNPGFSFVAVLTLAVGIAANTAVFSVVNAVLLTSLPFTDPGRLVAVGQASARAPDQLTVASYMNLVDWREQSRVFDGMAFYRTLSLTLSDVDGPAMLHGAMVSANLFPLLGIKPALGRAFLGDDENPANTRTVILSFELWRRRFGAGADILGQHLILNGQTFTIIGVTPPHFTFPIQVDPIELWISTAVDAARTGSGQPMTSRGYNSYLAVGRLRPDVTLTQARAEMDTIAARLSAQYPEHNRTVVIAVIPLLETMVHDIRPTLLLLFSAVCCVLLITCVNVANLLLARATVRRKEIFVRLALGAGRRRIMRQLLTESLLLAFMGGALGLALAHWAVQLLISAAPENVPRLHETGLDFRVLGFTVFLSIATALVCGLAPALSTTRLDITEGIKEAGRAVGDALRGNRLRGALVVTEIGLALMSLVSAGLLLQSFRRLRHVDPGFNPAEVLTLDTALTSRPGKELPAIAAFYSQLIDQVKALPGVVSASTVSGLPLSGNDASCNFDIAGRPSVIGHAPNGHIRIVGINYFGTMGIPMLQGRDFTTRDDFNSPSVIIINERLSRQYFAGENPIGKRITPSFSVREDNGPKEIIGVVANVKHTDLSSDSLPEMYLAHAQSPSSYTTLLVRTAVDPVSLVDPVRQEIRGLDKSLLVTKVRTLEEYVRESTVTSRFVSLLATVFAGVALLLTLIGLYSVMSYTVAQRTHEIGIRMALGARAADVLKTISAHGLKLTLGGVSLGLAGSFMVTRLMRNFLFDISATDPVVFVSISILLIFVALLACLIPAQRAARVDPTIALRYD